MNQVVHDPAKFHVGLKVLLINDQGQWLFLKVISPHAIWHDTWDLPGGRINQNEIDVDFHAIIDREIKEEVGDIKYELRTDPVSLAKCHYDDDSERFFILFEAKYISGDITLCHEHSGYEWKNIKAQDVDTTFHEVFKQLMNNYFNWNKS